jgi:hypothetical protein
MAAIAQFSRLHDRDNLPWMKQASFDRGTFASLLGVQVFDQGKSVQVLAIGDSLAVLGDGDRIIETFPYSKPSEFEQSPRLLCTNPAENSFLCEKNYTKSWTFDGLGQPTLLCMTDALGLSFIVLDVSLQALAEDKALHRFREGGETIIFKANDFADPQQSEIFPLLLASPKLTDQARNFSAICEADVAAVPTLEDFLTGKNIPAAKASTVTSRPVGPPISPQGVHLRISRR